MKNLTKLTSLNLSEQNIVLPSEISTKDVIIKNPLINIDSTPIKNITNINNSGIFDKSENTAKWLNIRTSSNYAFNFETKISVSSLEVKFSGRVSKDFYFHIPTQILLLLKIQLSLTFLMSILKLLFVINLVTLKLHHQIIKITMSLKKIYNHLPIYLQ